MGETGDKCEYLRCDPQARLCFSCCSGSPTLPVQLDSKPRGGELIDEEIRLALSLRLRLINIACLSSIALLLAGCAKSEAISLVELNGVREGNIAAVVMRFVDADPRNGPMDEYWVEHIVPAIGDFETLGAPTDPAKYRARYLSTRARTAGWAVMFMPAGYYYVVIHATNDGISRTAPQWRIEVPSNTPLIYIGSFSIAGETAGLLGAHWLRHLDQAATQVLDETQMAREFAAQDLAPLPPPITRLAVRHTGPYLIGVPAAVAP